MQSATHLLFVFITFFFHGLNRGLGSFESVLVLMQCLLLLELIYKPVAQEYFINFADTTQETDESICSRVIQCFIRFGQESFAFFQYLENTSLPRTLSLPVSASFVSIMIFSFFSRLD